MEKALLVDTIERLMHPEKGILAADESVATAGKRLEMIGVENTAENRQWYRELYIGAPDIEHYLSGIILHDETIRTANPAGIPFRDVLEEKDIIIGIKVDQGTIVDQESPNETVTEGLEGLSGRLIEYRGMGAKFAKWRVDFPVSETLPSREVIEADAVRMAYYASLCQECGIVPIIEPEVVMQGTHDIDRAYEVTAEVLKATFLELERLEVWMPGVILKTSMVVPGREHPGPIDSNQVADYTARLLREVVPDRIGGVVFLSGGQTTDEALQDLNDIVRRGPYPWEVTFSFARALQEPALRSWAGKEENIPAAQKVFIETVKKAVLARQGKLGV